ncbi:MAG: hypothetical protein ACFCUL_12845 [Flavobacteriaceae bacterium]
MLGKPITEDCSFLLENQAHIIGDNIYFSPLFHLKMTENPFKLEERQYPIDFVYPREDKYFMNISIPEGYQLISKPEDLNMAMIDNLAGFVYRITIQGQQLQVMASFKINQAIIAADQYAQLKEFFKNAIEKQTEKVVLSKIGNDGTKNSPTKGR